MRVYVFVDGENLRYSITGLFSPDYFDRRDYLPKHADWPALFDGLVRGATAGRGNRIRTYWYVVEHVDPYPEPLSPENCTPEKLAQWARRNTRLLSDWPGRAEVGDERTERLRELQAEIETRRTAIRRRFDGFRVVQNAIASRHASIEFRRSGGIGYNLIDERLGSEKTVDVNLAVDLVQFAHAYDLALIVSGDQDYVPAVQAAKNLGKQVVNVGFVARNGRLLSGGARRLNQTTDWSVDFGFGDFRRCLGLALPHSARSKPADSADDATSSFSEPSPLQS